MTDLGLRFSVDGPVARVVLDRPEVRNAQTPAMWRALADFGRSLPDDVRVVVLSGEGQSFSAGLDRRLIMGENDQGEEPLLALGAKPTAEVYEIVAEFQAGFSWLRNPNIVSIAAVQGHAVGAGFQLALACDLRVLTPDAKFSMREPALGLVPDLGGTQPLVQLVGYSRALEICATTRWVEAAEAKELGLANIVVPAEELAGTVKDLTDAVLTPLAGAVRETKALLLGAADRSYADQLKAEGAAQERRLKELIAAFG
ncbi:enoyl-CoA hydratase/isomerase family protein [Kribbella sandramycini]|uniref:Enoyl-CoA hydratase/carnithine racemase n=1 Tax=Kribbella sandramycini TaxID=60450 RepID=A0A7Y4P0H2_9ACTN|nr:enoyl-CoA hydratase/isomerase family protein [Kribbella sandramycini]MBB6569098.1 enoyl-CoA hydratase/carnithine racemase [Kribbella sandramycini]NOL41059.1 enoyl-CoA hydratase/isomerase family protein [Kribbella sandramycini]